MTRKSQVHTRAEIPERGLERYLSEIAYQARSIVKEATDECNPCLSTEYIREKIRAMIRICDELDHDMSLPKGYFVKHA